MLILNILTPMLNEDYFSAFVWPEGVPNLGVLPVNARRISSISDVLENCRVYYLTEGGRVPGGLLLGVLFWDLGKSYFNPFNALIMTVLVMEIYWLTHEGKVTLKFTPSYLVWIFFSLWAFNASFVDSCLWMSGSSNYLWMMVVVFAFLIPYVQNYYDASLISKDNSCKSAGIFLFGVIAGWSFETIICFLILVLGYWLYLCYKQNRLQKWKVSGLLGLCTGYMLLIFAPGNFFRFSQQHQINGEVALNVLFTYKFSELAWIVLFHFFLWYFIVCFLIRNKNRFINNKEMRPYLNIAKCCILVAFGSGILMFLIPVSGWRPSFLSLSFLVMAAASLFRGMKIINEHVLKRREKMFLTFVGYSYFIMTVFVSIWCNYINWNHWNDVLNIIKQEQNNPTNQVLVINPYFTVNKPILNALSGFHLIYMPVVKGDEKHRINVTLARYYGITGIKLKRENFE